MDKEVRRDEAIADAEGWLAKFKMSHDPAHLLLATMWLNTASRLQQELDLARGQPNVNAILTS